MMQCDDVAERLTDLMEGEFGDEEEAEALEHLASCERCEQVLAETRDVVRLVQDHGRPELDDTARIRMFSALASAIEASTET